MTLEEIIYWERKEERAKVTAEYQLKIDKLKVESAQLKTESAQLKSVHAQLKSEL